MCCSDDLLAGRLVKIWVGSPSTEFTVHENVLKASETQFFQAVFSNGFKETETGILELPEDDPATFRLLLQWVYGSATGFSDCEKKHFFSKLDYPSMLKLYATASKYMMNNLHDAIITDFWTCHVRASLTWLAMSFSQDAFSFYNKTTMATCPLDRLLVDWMVDNILQNSAFEAAKKYSNFDCVPERLVRAVFVKANRASRVIVNSSVGVRGTLQNTNKAFEWQRGALCSYHAHGADRPCPVPEYVVAKPP